MPWVSEIILWVYRGAPGADVAAERWWDGGAGGAGTGGKTATPAATAAASQQLTPFGNDGRRRDHHAQEPNIPFGRNLSLRFYHGMCSVLATGVETVVLF